MGSHLPYAEERVPEELGKHSTVLGEGLKRNRIFGTPVVNRNRSPRMHAGRIVALDSSSTAT